MRKNKEMKLKAEVMTTMLSEFEFYPVGDGDKVNGF